MHLKRWITAILLIPVLVYMIGFAPQWFLSLFLALVSLLGIREFNRITDIKSTFFLWSFNVSLTLTLFLVVLIREMILFPVIVAISIMIPFLSCVFYGSKPTSEDIKISALIIFAPLYLIIPLSLILLIRLYPKGYLWIFFFLLVVFSTDIGAFYGGYFFGRHPFFPKISPKKTWEGAIGGIILALLTSFYFLRIFKLYPFNIYAFIMILSVSISAQLGDLMESAIKRAFGIKDSGSILPGHGGILDRIDGVLFSSPVFYIFFYLVTLRRL